MSQKQTFTKDQLEVDADAALALIEQAGDAASSLVEAWVSAGNAAAVQEVAERGTGTTRKLARRGLNVLKAKRIPIPERHRKSSLVSKGKAEPEAWLMPPDAAGIRLLALSRGLSGDIIHATIVFFSDSMGVLRVENSETTRNKLKSRLSKLLPGAGYGAVQVPVDWARYKVAQARETHKKNKAPEPLGFTSAQSLLEPVPEQAPDHPFDAEGFEFSLDDAKELSKGSGSLHHMPEFRAWLPSQASVQELLSKVGQRFEPGEEPTQDKVSEFLKEEMLAATDRYFTPEVRAELLTRMKDSGLSVLARAGEQEALQLAATMQVVDSCGLVTDPPQEVPFLRAFFEKAVSVLMAQSGGKLSIPLPRPPAPATTEGDSADAPSEG